MSLFLHKALCKGQRGPKSGAQTGGDYLKRVEVGVSGDGTPKYRYLRTQDEVNAYHSEKKQSAGAGKDEGKKRLKEKLEGEQKESGKKTRSKKESSKEEPKKKESLLGKSLYVDLTWGTPDVPLVLGDK